jgi:hypothetical protein
MLIADILTAFGFLTDKGSGVDVAGNLVAATAGKGLRVKYGANCRLGLAGPMVGGALVVANTTVTAATLAFLIHQGDGAGAGALICNPADNVVGVSFKVTSNVGADTGHFRYLLVEPV